MSAETRVEGLCGFASRQDGKDTPVVPQAVVGTVHPGVGGASRQGGVRKDSEDWAYGRWFGGWSRMWGSTVDWVLAGGRITL